MLCHTQATMYKMGQRVLAENAGVMEVRYELPNKHYIPVDMKYIGVDNTTPYVVPISWFGILFGLGVAVGLNGLKELTLFWKYHLPRVVEQKLMASATRVLSFSRSKPLSIILCHPVLGYASRAWSTDPSPFISYFLIAHQTKRGGFHPSGRTKVR
jgi:hypothetical protein